MQSQNQPTLKEWQKLYELAIKFEKLAPWAWMHDTDIFGVINPETKEVGFCSVMGRNKEFYGLAVYQGTEGFTILDRIASGHYIQDEARYMQKCLMMCYDKRDHISKEDMDIIKEVGVKFDNRNFWPEFKDFSPGYYPWHLNQEQVRYLTIVVEQALEALLDIRDNKDEYMAGIPNIFLVRYPQKKGSKTVWVNKYIMAPEVIKKEIMPAISAKEAIDIAQIKKEINMHSDMIWEVGSFFSPNPVRETDNNIRPFFPDLLLIVEKNSGLIMSSQLSEPGIISIQKFRQALLGTIIKHKIYPKELHTRSTRLMEIFLPITKLLGIHIVFTDQLNMFDMARDSYLQDMRFRK